MLERNGMINYSGFNRWNQKTTIGMKLFDLAVLWYYCFGGSIVLRPMVSVFWPVMSVIGLFVFRMRLIRTDKYKELAILMIVVISASTIYSVSSASTIKYALSILLYFVIALEITSRKDNIVFFLNALWVYSLLLLMVTFIEKYAPALYLSTFINLLPAAYRSDINTFMRNGSVNGFFNQTSSNAVAMSLGVCVSFYKLICEKRSKAKKIACFIVMLAFIYGIVLTVRRASLLAVILILTIFLYSSYGNTLTKLLVIFAALGLILFGGISTIPFLSNIVSKTTSNAAAGDISDGRFTIWMKCCQLFSERPILGYGADSLQSGFAQVNNAHNSFIQSLVELGMVGAVVFFAPFIYGFLTSIKTYIRRKELNVDDQSLVAAVLFWQMYNFINAMFEALFAGETTVFMMFIMQMSVMQIIFNTRMNAVEVS